MEITQSEKKIRKWVDSLPHGLWEDFSVGALAKKLKLAPTTVKWRLEILRVLKVIEIDSYYRKSPKIKRIK